MDKKKTSVMFTGDARRLLDALSRKYGMSHTAMLEMIIRERARQEELWK